MSDDVIKLSEGKKDLEKYLAPYAVPCHHCGDRALSISLHDRKPRCTECAGYHVMVDKDGGAHEH